MTDKLVTLAVSNGRAFVWNGEDWLTLREKHRIVGALIGRLAHLPCQETFSGLPLMLLPEETTLLVENKVVQLVQYPSLCSSPEDTTVQQFNKYRESLKKEQNEQLMKNRKQEVTEMIDQIINGKKRKLLGENTSKKKKFNNSPIDPPTDDEKRALLKEEIDKIKPIPDSNLLVQTFTAHPWLKDDDKVPVVWHYPATPTETLRYDTFKDLWGRGYYLTSGHKFGVDFLLYPGDPVKFHAYCLVICLDNKTQLSGTDIVAFGRLGTSVRKTVVLASYSSGTNSLVYQSLTWDGFT